MAGKTHNPEALCPTCPYGGQHSVDPLMVVCFRFPPVFVELEDRDDGEYRSWEFPATGQKSSCGEHPDFWMEASDDGR
jgi:hypothetical protein